MDDRTYWNEYYAAREAVHYPSPFAEFCQAEYLDPTSSILELGPGSGRDSFYFFEHGHSVIGVDQSDVAIEGCRSYADQLGGGSRLKFQVGDFTDPDALGLPPIDVVYSRFTLHSIPADAQRRLLDAVPSIIGESGVFLAEARTIKDPLYGKGTLVGEHEFITDHYRRHLDAQEFLADVVARGFKVEYFIERAGLATFRGEDPVVLRVALRC